jgi:hypothetical protein
MQRFGHRPKPGEDGARSERREAMSAINDGGCAFPRTVTEYIQGSEGMTLRDYFAGQALTRIATEECDMDEKARWCYRLADALIEERQKGPQ